MNKILIPVKYTEKGNSSFVDLNDIQLVEGFTLRDINLLVQDMKTMAEANRTMLKEIKRLKFLNERYIEAGKNEYLNVIENDDGTINRIDKIVKVVTDRVLPSDIDNQCYYVDGEVIRVNESKLSLLGEVL